MHSLDTTPETAEVQREVLLRRGPSRRVELAFELSQKMCETCMAGIRDRNPNYSDRQVVLGMPK